MRAIVQDRYGDTEVLRLEEVERPEPGREQVLIRVRAAGVDPGVWHVMAGLPAYGPPSASGDRDSAPAEQMSRASSKRSAPGSPGSRRATRSSASQPAASQTSRSPRRRKGWHRSPPG